MKEVLIGFNSAWTDSSRSPGAIAACIFDGASSPAFIPPRLATFEAALQFILELITEADYALIAIDQPTVVPNYDSCRPVDRVAGSLVSTLRGGVQPARRGGRGAPMFGDDAPIWRFLAALKAIQNPIEARKAVAGRFLMEVFPALALPAIVPALWDRRRGAKYNPDRRKTFDPHDWPIVASGVAAFARNLASPALVGWLEGESSRESPRKADQDKLDAAICLTIALAWRYGPLSETLLMGDERTGYMATIASAQTRAVLVKAAEKQKRGVAEFRQIARRVWPEPRHTKEQVRSTCPECGHRFKGSGFDGIDAHWRSKHEDVMPYKEAWPLIKSGSYSRTIDLR